MTSMVGFGRGLLTRRGTTSGGGGRDGGLLALVWLGVLALGTAEARAETVGRPSVSNTEAQSNGDSIWSDVSGDGRFVAFSSDANNLVHGDTNGVTDVFVRDRQAGTTTRVSVGPGGAQGNDDSVNIPSISRNGRYAAFTSLATNLVPGDANGVHDVFVHDRQARTTRRVSVASGGVEGNDNSYDPSLSADGRFVVFYSAATNLVPGDTNGELDVFLHELGTGRTERVSVGVGGCKGTISATRAASRRTGGSSGSGQTPATSCRATATACRTCSCATGSGVPRSG